MTKEDFRAALARAMTVIDGVGKGTTKVSLAQRTAMVELMVLQVRANELRPAVYLQHPAHLPEGDELRVLLASAASKDQQLRLDAIEWREINRREAGIASVSLRNAIEATRIADELMNDPDADERLHEWKHEIIGYIHDTFGCDLREAPFEREQLDVWCLDVVLQRNPVPEWLRTWRPGNVAVVQPKTVQTAVKHYSEGADD